MHYEIRRNGDVAVVELSGELSSRYCPDIRQRIQQAMTGVDAPVILDFARVVYIDSSGLGALILLQQQMAERGQRMLIVNLTPQVKRVFDKVNLHRILVVCESMSEALFAFQNKRVLTFIGRKDTNAFYEEILKINHMTVIAAGSASHALELLAEHAVDLLLLDLHDNGSEVSDLLRRKAENESAAGIPTVLVSAHEGVDVAMTDLGITEFFHEPFEVDQFIETIRRLA